MIIRYSEKKDIPRVVDIHLSRFNSFFLSSLGAKFLHVYYRSFLKKPAILLVLEDDGDIKGFACGNLLNRSFYKTLLFQNFISFSLIGLYLLFTRPKSLFRIFFNLNHSGDDGVVYAELLSIASLKNKKGYGSALLTAFEAEVLKNSNDKENVKISLTTDYYNNDAAVNFYKSNNYAELKVFNGYQNRKMYRFIKQFN